MYSGPTQARRRHLTAYARCYTLPVGSSIPPQARPSSWWPLVVVGHAAALVRTLRQRSAEQEGAHVRHVVVGLVLVGVVPGAVQVEELCVGQRLRVRDRRRPREVVAATLDHERRDALPFEVGQKVETGSPGRGLRVLVGVEADTVERRTGRFVAAVQRRPDSIVDAVLSGVHLEVVREGVGGLGVDLQERVGEHRTWRKQESVDAQLLPGGKAERHAGPARRWRGIVREGEVLRQPDGRVQDADHRKRVACAKARQLGHGFAPYLVSFWVLTSFSRIPAPLLNSQANAEVRSPRVSLRCVRRAFARRFSSTSPTISSRRCCQASQFIISRTFVLSSLIRRGASLLAHVLREQREQSPHVPARAGLDEQPRHSLLLPY